MIAMHYGIVPPDIKTSRRLAFADASVEAPEGAWERGVGPASLSVAGQHLITVPLDVVTGESLSVFLTVSLETLMLERKGVALVRSTGVRPPPASHGMRTVRILEASRDVSDVDPGPLNASKLGGRPAANNFSPDEAVDLRGKTRAGHRLLLQLWRSSRGDFRAPGARPLGNGVLYVFFAPDGELSWSYSV